MINKIHFSITIILTLVVTYLVYNNYELRNNGLKLENKNGFLIIDPEGISINNENGHTSLSYSGIMASDSSGSVSLRPEFISISKENDALEPSKYSQVFLSSDYLMFNGHLKNDKTNRFEFNLRSDLNASQISYEKNNSHSSLLFEDSSITNLCKTLPNTSIKNKASKE